MQAEEYQNESNGRIANIPADMTIKMLWSKSIVFDSLFMLWTKFSCIKGVNVAVATSIDTLFTDEKFFHVATERTQ